ncbi:MAG: CocE/NonD family hydrolase [Firmicutes bacterium]|nr:CocE/NonD family hydrolase [Bacillota bacterium]
MAIAEYKAKRIMSRDEFPYEWEVTENVWIPMSDGCRCSARIWRPVTDKPLPAIFETQPYRKRDGMRGRDEPMYGFFAGMGYNVVRVDMRGAGESDDCFYDEYLKQEQDDAIDAINWIASQPWCDGNVGMMGKSWSGFNSLQVAARRPEPLKAIICVGFVDDRYTQDIHYKGGCLLNDNFWWGNIMQAYMCRPIDKEIKPETWYEESMRRLEEMPLWEALWLRHQTKDDYWRHGSVSVNYEDINIPVFALDGWADSYTNSVLTLMRGLDVPRKAMIGPWAHVFAHDGAPGPAIDFLGEATKWWDKWLKGVDNDCLDCPMVQVWLEDGMKPETVHPMSDGRWVGLEGWPSNDVEPKTLGLKYGRLFDPDKPHHPYTAKDSELILSTLPNHGLFANEWMGAGVPGESPADMRADDGMAIVFDSDILEEAVDILGYPEFEVEFTCDKPSAFIYAQLSDVWPDGAVTRVSYGLMNLTHLKGHDIVEYLEPGRKYKAKVELDVCGHNFAAGHRIRLTLANSFWPMIWPSPEIATIRMDLETAKFTLPLFKGPDCEGPMKEARCAPLTPITILQEGVVNREIRYDLVNDSWTSITDGVGGVFGEGIYRFDDIGTVVEHNLRRELTLSNKDPLSATYRIVQKMRNGRDGWIIDCDIDMIQTCDMDNFYIKGTMDAVINGEKAFHRDYDETIPRNGI